MISSHNHKVTPNEFIDAAGTPHYDENNGRHKINTFILGQTYVASMVDKELSALKIIEKYIEENKNNKGSINVLNYAGNTALIMAADAGNQRVVAILLDNGADLTHVADSNVTATTAARDREHHSIVDLLEQRRSMIPAKFIHERMRFFRAVREGGDANLAIIQQYIDKYKHDQAAMNTRDNNGNTALIHAAVNGHLPIVRALIDYAIPSFTNKDNRTAEQEAIKNHYQNIVDLLQSHRRVTSNELFQAAENENQTLVTIYLKENIGNAAYNIETALTLATEHGHLSIIKILNGETCDSSKEVKTQEDESQKKETDIPPSQYSDKEAESQKAELEQHKRDIEAIQEGIRAAIQEEIRKPIVNHSNNEIKLAESTYQNTRSDTPLLHSTVSVKKQYQQQYANLKHNMMAFFHKLQHNKSKSETDSCENKDNNNHYVRLDR